MSSGVLNLSHSQNNGEVIESVSQSVGLQPQNVQTRKKKRKGEKEILLEANFGCKELVRVALVPVSSRHVSAVEGGLPVDLGIRAALKVFQEILEHALIGLPVFVLLWREKHEKGEPERLGAVLGGRLALVGDHVDLVAQLNALWTLNLGLYSSLAHSKPQNTTHDTRVRNACTAVSLCLWRKQLDKKGIMAEE